MKFNLILSCFVAILALVNPIQKVLIVTVFAGTFFSNRVTVYFD